jgi:hypothetical protein
VPQVRWRRSSRPRQGEGCRTCGLHGHSRSKFELSDALHITLQRACQFVCIDHQIFSSCVHCVVTTYSIGFALAYSMKVEWCLARLCSMSSACDTGPKEMSNSMTLPCSRTLLCCSAVCGGFRVGKRKRRAENRHKRCQTAPRGALTST